MKRELIDHGAIRLVAAGCSFAFWKFRPGVLLMQISGDDTGQFGTITCDEADRAFNRFAEPIELYVDATKAEAPATTVMEDWIGWFAANRARLKRVSMLIHPDAKVLRLTIEITKHLSRTGDLIEICCDPDQFWGDLESSAPGAVRQMNALSA